MKNMHKRGDKLAQRHPKLAIAYVLSRWGETSLGDLYEACRVWGIDRAKVDACITALRDLNNLREENGRLVWIGKPYV